MKRGGRWIIAIAVFAVVAFLFLAGPNGLIKLIQVKQREVQLERKMIELKAEIELTRQKLERLASDPDYLRKVAAERLEMIDPRDTTHEDSTATDSISAVDTISIDQPQEDTASEGGD
ncbi:hypothetical protein GF359_03155 [candidate division WOR-3 bacterium]|uniref:Septum formation initiator family protein n=1 Tax=candidate division WOR-3 bacterium TaxID=2052148 RepID=A0A9D5K8D3_UNCW3|nr:hypothetical protein [candidate division WOR-3 bacterium]MBD3364193.1 hypothetical protein [candidate division WOR-3 bacterium]